MEPSSPLLSTVGTSPQRLDAREKVTGRATFISDLRVPGMVYTKLWRSPLPHARLRAIDTTAAAIGWGQPLQRGRGRGLACDIKAPLAPSVASALVRMHADGSVTLLAGTVEMGQGARTVLSQIVAEELTLPLTWVRLAQPESGTSPYDQATSSSRSTTLVGLALQAAARDLRQQLLELAAEQLQTHLAHLTLREGGVEGPGGRLSYAEIIADHFGLPGGELIGRGGYRGERGHLRQDTIGSSG